MNASKSIHRPVPTTWRTLIHLWTTAIFWAMTAHGTKFSTVGWITSKKESRHWQASSDLSQLWCSSVNSRQRFKFQVLFWVLLCHAVPVQYIVWAVQYTFHQHTTQYAIYFFGFTLWTVEVWYQISDAVVVSFISKEPKVRLHINFCGNFLNHTFPQLQTHSASNSSLNAKVSYFKIFHDCCACWR